MYIIMWQINLLKALFNYTAKLCLLSLYYPKTKTEQTSKPHCSAILSQLEKVGGT